MLLCGRRSGRNLVIQSKQMSRHHGFRHDAGAVHDDLEDLLTIIVEDHKVDFPVIASPARQHPVTLPPRARRLQAGSHANKTAFLATGHPLLMQSAAEDPGSIITGVNPWIVAAVLVALVAVIVFRKWNRDDVTAASPRK